MWILATNAVFAGDLNCNGIDEADEPRVDVADAVCAANVDPVTGQPYTSADRYFDYFTFGCSFLLDDRFDIDGDGLGKGLLRAGAALIQLQCDNCPSTFNPDQTDTNLDGVGDVCFDEPYLSWPDPGLAGMTNEFVLMDGTPSGDVRVMVSTQLGSTAVPGCGAVVVGLNAPIPFDLTTFSFTGNAITRRNVPIGIAGQRVYFQAVEPATCRLSNVVTWDF